MNTNNVINNILGGKPKVDRISKNKHYLGFDIQQKKVGPYNATIYVILKNSNEMLDLNGNELYFSTYNQAKYHIEDNLK